MHVCINVVLPLHDSPLCSPGDLEKAPTPKKGGGTEIQNGTFDKWQKMCRKREKQNLKSPPSTAVLSWVNLPPVSQLVRVVGPVGNLGRTTRVDTAAPHGKDLLQFFGIGNGKGWQIGMDGKGETIRELRQECGPFAIQFGFGFSPPLLAKGHYSCTRISHLNVWRASWTTCHTRGLTQRTCRATKVHSPTSCIDGEPHWCHRLLSNGWHWHCLLGVRGKLHFSCVLFCQL